MILAIYGAGGLGREYLELAAQINAKEHRWERMVFVDDNKKTDWLQNTEVLIYGELELSDKELEFCIAIGEPATRERLYKKLKQDRCRLATLIHPQVHISETTSIGEGVAITVGCFVSCNVEIQENVLLQPQCNIGHDDRIGAHSVISGFGNLGGACHIGRASYVGLSASIRELISIGDYSIIGMGAVVMRDVADEVIVGGNPARVMLKNEEHKVFNRNSHI